MPKNIKILDGYAMTNLSPESTGLPFVVFIFQNLDDKHDLQIQVGRSYKAWPNDTSTILIRPTVRVIGGQRRFNANEIALLTQWVELNRDVLIQFWDHDIESTADVLRVLKPINSAGERAPQQTKGS